MILPRFILKRQLKTNYWSLLPLFLFWWLCLLALLTLLAFYDATKWHGMGFTAWKEVIMSYLQVDWEVWAILSACALLVTSIHYMVLRAIRGDDRGKFANGELFLICSMMIFSALVGVASHHHLRLKIEWRFALLQFEINDELTRLVSRGNYHHAVQKMEASMAHFNHGSEMLGDDAEYYDLSASGISHLYTTCNLAWEHTQRHVPMGLRQFLQNDDYPRGKLGLEMSQSNDPVLRCFGYWMNKDSNFLTYAYGQAEKGNVACYGFALHAAAYVDSDPERAFGMASKVWREVRLENRTTDEIYIEIGARAEAKGHKLGQYEEGYRQALLRLYKERMKANQPYPDRFFLEALSRHGFDKERKDLKLYVEQRNNAK